MINKGIILAGGSGTRLGSMTKVVSKQLLPIYDKPLIFYPLSTLLSVGIKDILIIANVEAIVSYRKLFGDGAEFGAKISYEIQLAPNGIAEAYLIGEQFLARTQSTGVPEPSALILGDNLFYGSEVKKFFGYVNGSHGYHGCHVLTCAVRDPSRYGVIELRNGESKCDFYIIKSIEEKPTVPKTDLAVPGLYVFDSNAVQFAKEIKPSKRGELEITDMIDKYIKLDAAFAYILPEEFIWLDAGTPESMLEASNFVASVQRRTGRKFGCPYSTAGQAVQ